MFKISPQILNFHTCAVAFQSTNLKTPVTYRATPLPWCGLSPAELLMGRQVRTTVPQPTKHLVPRWGYLSEFRQKNAAFKQKQKSNFDSRHRTREAPEIPDNVDVWVSGNRQVRGTVAGPAEQPRSYLVSTPSGDLRRNRSHLNIVPPSTADVPEQPPTTQPGSTTPSTPPPSPIMTRSRTGHSAALPNYLRY